MKRVVLVLAGLAQAAAGASLEQVLGWMDRAASSFRAVEADLERISYTAVIDDNTVEKARMWMLRSASRAGDVRVRIEFREPDPKSVAFSGQRAEVYYPNIRTVQVYDLGKHRELVEQFLLLGFGTAGKDLVRQYQVRLVRSEVVDGRAGQVLELVPKSPKVRERLVKAELWILEGEGYPVRQKFYWPSGDTTTVNYRNIRINPPLQPSQLALELPPGVKREYPQR